MFVFHIKNKVKINNNKYLVKILEPSFKGLKNFINKSDKKDKLNYAIKTYVYYYCFCYAYKIIAHF